tara:strand:+ start:16241 stop:16633 length:393 start_codon:yes stop_codon:yes gene_type:complete
MKTQKEKKQFALEQIAPYYADPSTCGYDCDTEKCCYITINNTMCVAGKNMIKPSKWPNNISIISIINDNNEEAVFKPEVVGILTKTQWGNLQQIHDNIARYLPDKIKTYCEELGLFTYQELIEFSKKYES